MKREREREREREGGGERREGETFDFCWCCDSSSSSVDEIISKLFSLKADFFSSMPLKKMKKISGPTPGRKKIVFFVRNKKVSAFLLPLDY